MKTLSKLLLFVALASVFTGCIKKKGVAPKDGREGFNIISEWKVTNIQGLIDSTITINNQKYTTTFKTSYDSVTQQITQTYNGNNLFAKYPYSLVIKFNGDSSCEITEESTRNNSSGVPTPYNFTIYNTWNYTNSNREADGLVIRGFDNTSVLGPKNINPAQGTTKYIGDLINKPFFTTYDVRNGHLMLFVHVLYTGNPDTPNGQGGFYNPLVSIKADYEITFSRK